MNQKDWRGDTDTHKQYWLNSAPVLKSVSTEVISAERGFGA